MLRFVLCLTVLLAACEGAEPGGPDGGGGVDGGPSDQGMGTTDLGAVLDLGPSPDQGAVSDQGVVDPWATCPTAGDAVFDPGWATTATANADAIYCATFNESRTLRQERELKAMIRVPMGTYRLPPTDAQTMTLPFCARTRSGVSSFVASATVSHTGSGSSTLRWSSQPTVMFGADERLFEWTFSGQGPAPLAFALDGGGHGFFGEGFLATLCDGADQCYSNEARMFQSCHFSAETLHTHVVTFTGGTITLELRIGTSPASTEPGAFVAARGTLDGVGFDVTDYFRLIYRPAHHHFTRHFAVFFDEGVTVGGACGIEVRNLEPWDDYDADEVHLVDCDFNRLSERTVSGHTWTTTP